MATKLLRLRKGGWAEMDSGRGKGYVIGSFREGPPDDRRTVYQLINGQDGITYCCMACELTPCPDPRESLT